MTKRFFALVFFGLLSLSAFSETFKPGVVVIGGNCAGTASAFQASRSGVKTLLIEKSTQLGADFTQPVAFYKAGLYQELVKNIYKLRKDSTSSINAAAASTILKTMADTVKNLKLQLNTTYKSIKKSGKGWEIKLSDGTTVHTDVLIDATSSNEVVSATGGNQPIIATPFVKDFYSNKLYRTSVSVGHDQQSGEPYFVPLAALIIKGQVNLVAVGKIAAQQSSADAMLSGQAAGASGAFCSFFKTTTETLNVRTIQSELFSYKSLAVPFTDIQTSDPDFTAIQHISLSGALQGKKSGAEFKFNPDSTVSTEEIRLVFKEYVSRSQIWFLDKKIEKMTLGDMLSLIKYTANRGDELNREVERGWAGSFNFKGKFDLKHILTRREFVVLSESYLKPFTVRIDLTGRLGS
ncbi:FAD-dependent oxidoreductase [Pedobacter sp. HMF7647]|uniref:FAD-dependent oxidoreductase n=1 Tax=Hufsiella arboris TaxID=2695275 RepID=A0A7K1Y6E4_9SPHI|nr:FAD-dependent oxidoreductase [Hufsiella arboris]MXV49608.1 FAD-dependent oxidoreductase [Hufsiella arboris]